MFQVKKKKEKKPAFNTSLSFFKKASAYKQEVNLI